MYSCTGECFVFIDLNAVQRHRKYRNRINRRDAQLPLTYKLALRYLNFPFFLGIHHKKLNVKEILTWLITDINFHRNDQLLFYD